MCMRLVAAKVLLQLEVRGAARLAHVVWVGVAVGRGLGLHHLLLLSIYLKAAGAGQTLGVYLVAEDQAWITFLVCKMLLVLYWNRLHVLVVKHTLCVVGLGRLVVRLVCAEVAILFFLRWSHSDHFVLIWRLRL